MSARHALLHEPDYVMRFVRDVIREQQIWNGKERRQDVRVTVCLPVTVQPLDTDFEPVGEPFKAITRNLSGGGIGLLNDEPIDTDYVLVTLRNRAGDEIDLVAHIRHCTYEDGGYLIGGRFIVRWDS